MAHSWATTRRKCRRDIEIATEGWWVWPCQRHVADYVLARSDKAIVRLYIRVEPWWNGIHNWVVVRVLRVMKSSVVHNVSDTFFFTAESVLYPETTPL